jgi:hypothetical protein
MAVLLTLVGGMAFAQSNGGEYAPPETQLPLPLYSNRPENGGFYFAPSFVMMRQTNPLRNQTIAIRGFVDVDGSISGNPGTFIGNGAEALNARNVSGPMTYQPGTRIDVGWKFVGEEGEASVLNFSWMYFTEAKYNAQASLAVPFQQGGPLLEDTFLYSPVYGFPNDYSGPPNKVNRGDANAAFGIWNAASIETIQFIQKLQQWEVTYRIPAYSTECYRLSGYLGGRFLWIWEQFKWSTFDLDALGNNGPLDTGVYTNIVSNRMYGPTIGCVQEWYVGHGFACMLDLGTAAFLDVVKERIRYQFADRTAAPQSKLGRVDYTIAFQFTGSVGLMWYPVEGIQVKFGWDLWFLLNSLASEQPINFAWGSPAYQYDHVFRTFDGLNAGIAFIF